MSLKSKGKYKQLFHSLDQATGTCYSISFIDMYDWEIHKGLLEVFDKYVFRYIFDISVLIALK
jgi:hypothetical protein